MKNAEGTRRRSTLPTLRIYMVDVDVEEKEVPTTNDNSVWGSGYGMLS